MNSSKVLVGIQARTNSSRLLGKIYKPIGGRSLLEWVYEAARRAVHHYNSEDKKGRSAEIAVLCPFGDKKLLDFCLERKMSVTAPPRDIEENDLWGRVMHACKVRKASHFVRLTADCWTIPTPLITMVMEKLEKNDYVSNTIIRSFPEGWDIQGASVRFMRELCKDEKTKEHPFYEFDHNQKMRDAYIQEGFKLNLIQEETNPIFRKLSIDTEHEYQKACEIYEEAKKREKEHAQKTSTGGQILRAKS